MLEENFVEKEFGIPSVFTRHQSFLIAFHETIRGSSTTHHKFMTGTVNCLVEIVFVIIVHVLVHPENTLDVEQNYPSLPSS